ncbi:MAG: ribosome biogenesis GTPase Der [Eggerthellales bacterium]|nr:ribosome biogenesis GTPase Der [Eggerthellales bacterium]
MALPIVAVVGRPNVGKSTFVNRIAQKNDAIVHEMRGVTRDRSYHKAEWCGVEFMLVDTGGIESGDDDRFQSSIRDQALMAAEEADCIVFIVDGKTGMVPDDMVVAQILKRTTKPVVLAVNKVDTPGDEAPTWEFFSLGIGDPWPISSTHGNGTGDILDEIVSYIKDIPVEEDPTESMPTINVAIIGRPNAGKSSLTNRLIGQDRSIVSDVAGTTRDAIDTPIIRDDTRYVIVDTAGLRRKSQINEDVEYYGFVRAMRAIDRADVALLVLDATLGLTDQDQRVAGYAAERGCAMIILLNKRDAVDCGDDLNELREDIKERMGFVGYAPVISISALSGKGVSRIWDAIDAAYANFSSTLTTSRLNSWLQEIREFGHTVSSGKRMLRLKYVTQTRICPPEFTFFCNHPDLVNSNFERYLENRMRSAFDFTGTPINLKFKKKD